MFVFPLLAAAFAFADPAGDAHGDGLYVLPTQPTINADALDLREFRAQAVDNTMRFTVSFGAISNPWRLASGFSDGVTDIFIKSGLGGIEQLSGLNLKAGGAGGWQYHLRVSGSGASLERFTEGGEAPAPMLPPTVQLAGTNLIIGSAVPAGQYGYWVTSSVYTPLSTDDLMRPSTQASPSGLQADQANAPVPVDVLAAPGDNSAYSSGDLVAVGQTSDTRPWWLISLGGLGLVLTGWATWRLWHRQ